MTILAHTPVHVVHLVPEEGIDYDAEYCTRCEDTQWRPDPLALHAFVAYEQALGLAKTYTCGYLGCGASAESPVHHV